MIGAADAARDVRVWPEAARLYRKAHIDGSLAPIWVQYGHALKEARNLTEAEMAYRQALSIDGEVADTHLQLGHLYKRMRRISDTIAAYREALRIDGSLLDARQELAGLGITGEDIDSSQALACLREPGTFIDLSDVFFYLRHHQTVSGIQRVQLGIANAIIAMSSQERNGILFLSETEDQRGYVVIEDVFVNEISKELSRKEVEPARLMGLMRSATAHGRPYEPVAGDSLLILGAFWVLQNIGERIIHLRRKGVSVSTLIHDIIPITHPEFCDKSLTNAFRPDFFSVLSMYRRSKFARITHIYFEFGSVLSSTRSGKYRASSLSDARDGVSRI